MKICVAQLRPVAGDIVRNIQRHKQVIELAATDGANIIIFPELSITGYEPTLARQLATNANDARFDEFQEIADTRRITIGVGVPTKQSDGICISLVLFQPQTARTTYSKRYLHADEEPFFVSGDTSVKVISDDAHIAFAICYEVFVPEHAADASRRGATIYVASVAKPARNVERAVQTLSDIARKYSMTVLMSNSVGPSDNFEAAGKTSVWNDRGVLLAQLTDASEGWLMLDTTTQEVVTHLV
jgi:predicted amidohydrolase